LPNPTSYDTLNPLGILGTFVCLNTADKRAKSLQKHQDQVKNNTQTSVKTMVEV